MNRENKFRAWSKKYKIMCDVAAINYYSGNVVLLARDIGQIKLFTEKNKQALINCTDRLSVNMEDVELMQYTGLKDRNNKQIYKGDIIKEFAEVDEHGKNLYYFYKIVWDRENYSLSAKEIFIKYHVCLNELGNIEIIGNIYDKPEPYKEVEE